MGAKEAAEYLERKLNKVQAQAEQKKAAEKAKHQQQLNNAKGNMQQR